MSDVKRPDDVGLWRKFDRNGREYYYAQATIEEKKYQFNCFQNKFKNEGDKTPDFKSAPDRKPADPVKSNIFQQTKCLAEEGRVIEPVEHVFMEEEQLPF